MVPRQLFISEPNYFMVSKMQIVRWQYLNWWKRTCLITAIFVAASICLAFILVFSISGGNARNPLISAFIYSAYPLSIIFLIGVLARIRERMDVKADVHFRTAQTSGSVTASEQTNG